MTRLYLVDFDGTITKQDTLDYICKKFFPEKYIEWGTKIMNKEYSVSDWIKAFVKEFNVAQKDYDKALEEIEINKGFKRFLKDKELVIVSGGFDYNIKKILNKFEIENIEFYANNMEFISNEKIEIKRPYFNDKCRKEAVCKTDIYLKYRKSYDEIVYIGDGITDVCVAKYCDIIYAKRGAYLERELKRSGHKYISFSDFDEIEESLKRGNEDS